MQIAKKRNFLNKNQLYTELEYIQSTGTQWIDTQSEFTPKNGLGFIYDGTIDSSLYCGQGFYTPGGLHFVYDNLWGNNIIRTGGGEGTGYEYTIGNRITINAYYDSQTRRTLNINGHINQGNAYNALLAPLYIFKMSGIENIVGKLYSCILYDNENTVRDLIPVKDKNDVVCMYDKISKTFFYNQGTGDFIAGPEK